MITWPDFRFPPVNLYVIGPAYAQDSKLNLCNIIPLANGIPQIPSGIAVDPGLLLANYYYHRNNG